jgi:hypothetical protein
LLFQFFLSTAYEAHHLAGMIQACSTVNECPVRHAYSAKGPIHDRYSLYDKATNTTLGELNTISVGRSVSEIAERVLTDCAAKVPIVTEHYCACPKPNGEERFWQCTEEDFRYVDQTGKCPPKRKWVDRPFSTVKMAYCYGSTHCAAPCTVSEVTSGVCANQGHEGVESSTRFSCQISAKDNSTQVVYDTFSQAGCVSENVKSHSEYSLHTCYPDGVTGGGNTFSCE